MKKIVLILLALILLISVCSCAKEVNNIEEEKVTQSNEDNKDGSFYKYDSDVFEAAVTPYASLVYPVEWKDSVKVDITESEEAYKVMFVALLDGLEVPLYAIVFGDSDTGNIIGEISKDTTTVTVYCEDLTEGSTDLLTPESADIYLQMSEDINVIISDLVYKSGMELC